MTNRNTIIPFEAITMNMLAIELQVNRACLRSKLVLANIVPSGVVYVGGYKTNLYLKTDLAFLYKIDFSKYVKNTKAVDASNDHPFYNSLATKFIRSVK